MDRYKHIQCITYGLWRRCHKPLLCCVLVVLQWVLPSIACAYANQKIDLVLSSDQKYYQKTAAQIKASVQQKFHNNTFTTHIIDSSSWPTTNSALVVAIGSKACDTALKKVPQTPLLCTFLPSSNYFNLTTNLPVESSTIQRSAIYFDQPMSRYMTLIKLITPKAQHLGTTVGPQSIQLLPEISALAKEQQLELHQAPLRDNKNPLSALTSVVEQSDVFLVNPDKAKLNKSVAKWLLRLCIRQRIPVIAYSSNYVNAGALAAIYSSPENIGRDAGETINRWLTDPSHGLEKPHYPRYFTVSTNPHVARALSIKLPGNKQLQTDIRQALNPLITTNTTVDGSDE